MGIIDDYLSQVLQKTYQHIVNAMNLVNFCKGRLQLRRESHWDLLLERVFLFCHSHDIEVFKMDVMVLVRGRKGRKSQPITNLHHYRVEVSSVVIDMQLQELNNRFIETSNKLLLCVACLNMRNSFVDFDILNLVDLLSFIQ